MSDLNTLGGIHYDMMRRCYNEKSVLYPSFGAKGIKVCSEWHDRENFKSWAQENGYEKGMRLNRVDPLRDYEPNNCVFGTKNKKLVDGKSQKIKESIKKNKAIKQELGIANYKDHPLYRVFYGMHTRCENEKHVGYKYYGAKGIKVCDEWSGKDGFKNFARWANAREDYKEGLTIDRIDSSKDYCPSNCKWSTMYEQALNKKNVRVIEYNGVEYSISGICKKFGLNQKEFEAYLEKGIDIDIAIPSSQK